MSGSTSATCSRRWPVTSTISRTPASRSRNACHSSSVLPPNSRRIFGESDCNRVPRPAAQIKCHTGKKAPPIVAIEIENSPIELAQTFSSRRKRANAQPQSPGQRQECAEHSSMLEPEEHRDEGGCRAANCEHTGAGGRIGRQNGRAGHGSKRDINHFSQNLRCLSDNHA